MRSSRAGGGRRRSRRLPGALLLAIASSFAACSAPAPEPDALAGFEGGSVTVDELERALLSLPPSARTTTPETRDERYRSLLRQLAMRELLIARGRSLDLLATPEVSEPWEETRKQIVVAAFLRSAVDVPHPTADEVREFFESHHRAFDRPERREVYHIFLRPREGESGEELAARLEILRRQAMDGAPFPILAREHSESQLRSGDGSLGWVVPGQLAPKLNDIIFGLEEGVPSEVLMTPSGAHLFYAARVVAAQPATFEEARPVARRQLQQRLQSEAVAAFLETHPLGADDFVPDEAELGALMAGGDPNAIVLQVGDFVLTAGQFFEQLEEAGGREGGEVERGPRLLEAIAQRERLWSLAGSSEPAGEPSTLEALATAEANTLFTAMQRRALLDRIDAEPAALEAFFDRERARFAGPLRFNFERLFVPLDADSGRVMAELERSHDRLAAGELTLAELAARVGGMVEGPLWKTLESLLEEGGPARRGLSALETGEYSRASTNGREVELFHLLERSAPRLPELDEVRDAVREAYLQAHGEKLYETLVDEWLAAAGFEIYEQNLERYLERAAGIEPSPEES